MEIRRREGVGSPLTLLQSHVRGYLFQGFVLSPLLFFSSIPFCTFWRSQRLFLFFPSFSPRPYPRAVISGTLKPHGLHQPLLVGMLIGVNVKLLGAGPSCPNL